MNREDIAALTWQRWASTEEAITKDGATLRSDLQKRVRDDPTSFIEECGTHYIGGLIKGAEYTAVIHSSTKSVDERRAFEAAVKAAATTAGGRLNLAVEFERRNVTTSLRIVGTQAGGVNSAVLSLKDLDAKFQTFPNEAKDNKVILSATLIPYPGLIEIPRRTGSLEAGERLATEFDDKVGTFKLVFDRPQDYDIHPESVNALKYHAANVGAAADKVWQLLEQCRLAQPPTEPNPAECQQLRSLIKDGPPGDRDDRDLPKRFAAPCDKPKRIAYENNITQFKVNPPPQHPTQEFVFFSKLEPGLNNKVLFAELKIYYDGYLKEIPRFQILRADSGCRFNPSEAFKREQKQQFKFTKLPSENQLFVFDGKVLETAGCTFNKNDPNCYIKFSPIDVEQLNEELFDANGKARERTRFTKSTWLAEK